MITKVAYNAYASSANGLQKQNKSQNVNFGSRTAQLQDIMDFANKFLPPHRPEHFRATQMVDNLAVTGRLETFLNFLGFCQRNPKAKGEEILNGTNELQELKNLTFGTKKAGLAAWIEILDFCQQNPNLTAERIHAGAIKEMPIEKMGQLLEFQKGIVSKLMATTDKREIIL